MQDLISRFGPATREWRWERLHTVTLHHPFGMQKPLDRLFDIGPFGYPGGSTSMMSGEYNITDPYAVTVGASYRQIFDLGDRLHYRAVLPSGQSGQVLHPHYDDQTAALALGAVPHGQCRSPWTTARMSSCSYREGTQRWRSRSLCGDALGTASVVTAFTGAGISAESGVPTFRSEGGLWKKMKPEELASMDGFIRNPALVWEWYAERKRIIADVAPNPGHRALAQMQDLFPRFAVVTQNIDNLHRRAGSRVVHELHGNIERNYCMECGSTLQQRGRPCHARCACLPLRARAGSGRMLSGSVRCCRKMNGKRPCALRRRRMCSFRSAPPLWSIRQHRCR